MSAPAALLQAFDLQGRVATRVAQAADPSLVLVSATSLGKDLGPRIAAGLESAPGG